MLRRSILFLGVFTFSTLAFGQQAREQPASTDAPDTTACSFTYGSGPLTTFTRYRLSVNGNIVQLDSPSGFEFINNGGLMEGYAICDVSPNVSYYDYASIDSANWGATVVTALNDTTRQFVRSTSDGLWQLTPDHQTDQGKRDGSRIGEDHHGPQESQHISRNVTLLRVANVNAGPVAT